MGARFDDQQFRQRVDNPTVDKYYLGLPDIIVLIVLAASLALLIRACG